MGSAYPELVANHDVISKVIRREEESFRGTLQRGVDLLDDLLARGDVSGEDAFFLHDTLGFPIDLTREIAAERGRAVDIEGFESRMLEQRTRARAAADEVGCDGRRTPSRSTASSSSSTARPSSPGATNTRRPRPCSRCCATASASRRPKPARRSMSCWIAPRSTPSRVARSATPARSRPTTVSNST